jgi:hypothetical protein
MTEPITVECHTSSEVAWTGPASTMIRNVEMDGWSGRVIVLPATGLLGNVDVANREIRPLGNQKPNITGQVDTTSGHFHGIAQQVELNPQPIPPGHAEGLGTMGPVGVQLEEASARTEAAPVTNDQPQVSDFHRIGIEPRKDPSGFEVVENIDFRVELVSKPT